MIFATSSVPIRLLLSLPKPRCTDNVTPRSAGMIAAHTTARTPAETIDAATRIEDFLAAWASRHPDQHTIARATPYARHGQDISVHRAVVTGDGLRNLSNARNGNGGAAGGN